LSGGTGGGSSAPFFSEAPSGKSTRSKFEVEEINIGSEISPLEIVFFRNALFVLWFAKGSGGAEGGAEKDCWSGVLAPDSGGVMLCANEPAGESGEGSGSGLHAVDVSAGDGTFELRRSRDALARGCNVFTSK